MEFRETLLAAQRNQQQKSSSTYYKARFDPPKKEQRPKDKLSANIQKFLAKKDEEEKQRKLDAVRKRDELLAMRDPKAMRKIQKSLKVFKSANKSVLADAVDHDNTAVTLNGPEQPDQDDYGYESQEAAALYEKMMQKYSKIPDEPKFPVANKSVKRDINGTIERVKHALQHEDDPVPHKRRRKTGDNADRELTPPTKYELEKKNEEKPEKPKFRKPAPPPMDFNQLLKLAEQKKSEPLEVGVKKTKPETTAEPERLMTKKQKQEYEEEMARRQRRQERIDAQKGPRKIQKDDRPVEKEKKPESLGFGRIPKIGDRNNGRHDSPKAIDKDRERYERDKAAVNKDRERNERDRDRDRYERDRAADRDRDRYERDRAADRDRDRYERDRASDRDRDRYETGKAADRDRDRYERDKATDRDRERYERDKAERVQREKERAREKEIAERAKAERENERIDRERLERLKAERDRIDREMERLAKDKDKLDKTKSILEAKTIDKSKLPLDKSKLNPPRQDAKKSIDLKSQNTYRIDKNSNEKKGLNKIDSRVMNGLSSQGKPVPKQLPVKDKPLLKKPEGSPKLNGQVRPENGKRPLEKMSGNKSVDRKPLPQTAGSSKQNMSNSFDFDKHVNSLKGGRQFPPGGVKKKPQPDDRKKPKRRLESDEDYDSEMDDFIDDGDEPTDYSKHIQEIFGYDKSRYRDLDDDDDPNMESSFVQQQREEYISKKHGIMEDLEDMRQEAMMKAKSKGKKKRRISDD